MAAAKKKAPLPESNDNWKIVDPKDAKKEIKKALSKKKSGKKRPVISRKGAQRKPGTGKSAAKNNKKVEIKKEPQPPKKPGRSTKYDPDTHPLMAWVLAVLGKTNKEIAKELSISTGTLFAWGKEHPDFLSTVKGGKELANARVVKALYTRAIGTRYPETKIIQNPDGTTRKEVTMKEIPPDVTAIIRWLTNRDPKNWRDLKSVALGGDPGAPPVQITNMSDEDLLKKVAEIAARQKSGGP